jgi:3-methyladenine DNA glycosylase/8-oxoguanine DNA glycosylase
VTLFEERLELREPDVTAPYSFAFDLAHYVIAPEVREGDTLVQVFRLRSGRLVKVDVASRGTAAAPALEFRVACEEPVSAGDLAEVRGRVSWHLGLDERLGPFYDLVADDRVLSASVAFNYGAKGKSAYSLFDAVVDCICAQNTDFRRVYAMRRDLGIAFGERLEAGGRVYHAAPTPEQLAEAPLESIRACGVGYRDRFLKGVAEAVVGGVDLEAVRVLPREQARRELMALPGVGPYTADLALIIGARRRDWMFLDLYIREALRQFYFDGEPVGDAELRAFAERAWGPYQGWAALYLTTDTELWAHEAGKSFRLKSGARSDLSGQAHGRRLS